MLAFVRALWPIYRWLSPIVVFVIFMGMLLSWTFVPGGGGERRGKEKTAEEHERIGKRE